MCGRYAITLAPEAMAQMFDATPANDLPPLPDFNVCPTVQVATVRSADGLRSLAPMRWGFVPHWYKTLTDGPLLINARAETLAEKPAFRAAARARRCLIPASGYYEWTSDAEGKRLPWYIHPADDDALVFAGIWQDWEVDGAALRSCAIVTTQAQGAMAKIHHRMPVILRPEDWPLWLGETGHGAGAADAARARRQPALAPGCARGQLEPRQRPAADPPALAQLPCALVARSSGGGFT